jgi:hypothetical protein
MIVVVHHHVDHHGLADVQVLRVLHHLSKSNVYFTDEGVGIT